MDAAYRNRYPIGMFVCQKPIQIESLVVELKREKKNINEQRMKDVQCFFFFQMYDFIVIFVEFALFSASVVPGIGSTFK